MPLVITSPFKVELPTGPFTIEGADPLSETPEPTNVSYTPLFSHDTLPETPEPTNTSYTPMFSDNTLPETEPPTVGGGSP